MACVDAWYQNVEDGDIFNYGYGFYIILSADNEQMYKEKEILNKTISEWMQGKEDVGCDNNIDFVDSGYSGTIGEERYLHVNFGIWR